MKVYAVSYYKKTSVSAKIGIGRPGFIKFSDWPENCDRCTPSSKQNRHIKSHASLAHSPSACWQYSKNMSVRLRLVLTVRKQGQVASTNACTFLSAMCVTTCFGHATSNKTFCIAGVLIQWMLSKDQMLTGKGKRQETQIEQCCHHHRWESIIQGALSLACTYQVVFGLLSYTAILTPNIPAWTIDWMGHPSQ